MPNKAKDGLNRRRILRQLSAVGVGTAGVTTGSFSAAADTATKTYQRHQTARKMKRLENEIGFKVTGHTVLDRSDAAHQLRYAFSELFAGDLKKKMMQDGLRPDPSNLFAMSMETDNEEVNQRNPVVATFPFVPRGDLGDRGGLLNFLVVSDDDGNRVVSGATGFTATPSNDSKQLKLYGLDGFDAKLISTDTFTRSSEGVAAAAKYPSIGCATCNLMYDSACYYVTQGAAISAVAYICAPTGIGVFACAPAAYVILQAVRAYGCLYTGAKFCQDIVNFC
jgi:hypothetical protein